VGKIDEVPMGQELYRGYRISLFGNGTVWSFKLAPTKIDLPPLKRSIFFKVANAKACALTVAKIEIDRLMEGSAKGGTE
jgi:hypothetical protein